MLYFDACPTMDINSEYERGFQLRCEGNYGEAKAVFQSILTLNPDHVKARLQFGLIQGFEGDFDSSLDTLNALSATNPADLDVRFGLAMTQLMLGMFDEGCGNLKHILSIDPNHEEALRQSAYC